MQANQKFYEELLKRYTVTIEPHNRRWLFALDMPGVVPPRAIVNADYLLLGQTPITLIGDNATYTCDALIIGTGASAKYLGLPNEERLQKSGGGVSACATCDGFFYRGRKVLVIGGGNTAVEEALFLTNFASEVTLIHRRDSFKAERILQNRLFAHPKIKVIWNSVLDDVVGGDDPKGVTGARIRNVGTGAIETLAADGIFIAIGHKPATELFEGQLPFKQGGYLITEPRSTQTAIEGVFAGGDDVNGADLVVTALADGHRAAAAIHEYLATK